MFGGSWLDERVEVSQWTVLLAIGDVLALTAFVAVGQTSHASGNPLLEPVGLLGALAPFLVGWVLVAILGGLYTHDVLLGPRRMLSWTIPAWFLGAIVALALRATSLFPGNVTGLFPIVAIAFGGLLLIGWRGAAAVLLAGRV